MSWEDVSDPQCSPHKVLLQIKAASINHLDIWVRIGVFPNLVLPHIPGSDGSGVIVDVGSEVNGWSAGDDVMIQPGTYCSDCRFCLESKENYCLNYGIIGETENGTHCELMVLNPSQIVKKPSEISFEEAAAFPLVFLTAYGMLIRRAKIEKDETILILGAGSGIGSAAIQIAKLKGCTVIATAGSEEKLKLAKELNADFTINHSKEIIHDKVKEITGGKGVDVVVEHVGESTWESSLKSLGRGGRIVTCGATTGPTVKIDLRHLFMKQQSILGSSMGDATGFCEVVSWLEDGKIKPIVDRTFLMSHVQDAHEYIENRKQFGKVVLVNDFS